MREKTYNLLDSVNIGDKDITQIRLCAPTMVHMTLVSKLQQGLAQADASQTKQHLSYFTNTAMISEIKKMKENAEKKETVTDDPILACINLLKGDQTNNDSYSNFCNTFKELLLMTGICYVDGSKGLGSVWLDRFSVDDFEKMMGVYVTNFLLPSQK